MLKIISMLSVSILIMIYSFLGNIKYEKPDVIFSLLSYSQVSSQNIKYEKKCLYIIDTKLFCEEFKEVK